jgi:NADP-dependent 3-hydroxy acid dehydrogenase YdfG
MGDPSLRALIPDPTDITEKKVLVTGGTTGIGRAVLRLLAERGARLVTFGRSEDDLNSAVEEIRGLGGDVHGVVADASRLDDVRRVFQEVDTHLGGLDVLVNNAAIAGGDFEEQSIDTIDYVVRTNVVGYLACAHEAVERMKHQGRGHVVLIGSMSADLREEGGGTYVATKGAIQAFAESLRKTVNEQGIKVTLIEPGKVATPIVETPEVEMEKAIADLEMLRSEDVAGAVLYALLQPERCDIVSLQIRPHRQVI